MKQKNSITALVLGIKAVISKYRASLTVKEIELLQSAIDFLQETEKSKNLEEKQLLILRVMLQFSSLFGNPVLLEKIKNILHHLF